MNEMSERNSVLVAYGLYLLGAMTGGLTTLIGTVLAHIRLSEARGTLYESHYRNLILIFWVWLVVIVVAGSVVLAGVAGVAFSLFAWPVFGMALIPFGLAVWLMGLAIVGTFLWYYWRLVRGLVLVVDGKPY
ncbi:MAG TPA: hypothetical protein VHX92_03140 [Rhizomicrobium sp.]|jgi:uncharacterized membrane protein|nr:hypothetical protein [Rhizomicrobium sp.]